MPTPPLSKTLTDDECRAIAEAYRQHGTKQAAADALGLDWCSFNRRLKVAAQRGYVGTRPVLPGYVIKRASAQLGPDGEPERQWVTQTPEPGEAFAAPEGHAVKGVSALVDAEGRVIQQWIKTKAGEPSPATIADEIRAALEGFTGAAPSTPAPEVTEADLATIYPLADWHIGLLTWERETGQNYDLKIADATIRPAMARLVAGAPPSSQAVILGLGDLLHSDGYEPLTARSKNVLDVDGRYPRVLRYAVRLALHTIDLALQKHDRVLVRFLPGNHDDQSAIALSLALSLYYQGNPRVTVDDDPSRFWWWSWGDVLLGATHGDQAKMKDLPLIMAARNPEAWGRSKFRHIYTGHIHTQTGIEMSGVTVESFQTPAPVDAWHHGMGYGAGRSVCAITHHKRLGEISRHKVNIVAERVAA